MLAPEQFAMTIGSNIEIGRSHYGEIGLSTEEFSSYVWNITLKHLRSATEDVEHLRFATRLHLRDLYLACGCVRGYESAWQIFAANYRKLLADLVRFSYRRGTDSEEVADSILVSLYLADRSGQQRIASYDGRSSLATWLRVIVVNRAINQSHEQRLVNVESAMEVPDSRALQNLDSELHAGRYQEALMDCVKTALDNLTTRERLMLLWRYEENMQLGEMAKLLGIHQSNVTRQLEKLQARLCDAITSLLSSKHNLSPPAIAECLRGAAERPLHFISLLDLIKQTPHITNATGKRAS